MRTKTNQQNPSIAVDSPAGSCANSDDNDNKIDCAIENENKSLGIKFNDTYYSNPKHENISQLYKFKKTLQDTEKITPILDDSEETNDFLSFTPITPNDLLYINELLPPKSTWITPRI